MCTMLIAGTLVTALSCTSPTPFTKPSRYTPPVPAITYVPNPIVPPPQCDHTPTRRYVIKDVPEGTCAPYVGPNGGACGGHRKDGSCFIWMENRNPHLRAQILRHEFGHCNCPNWRD